MRLLLYCSVISCLLFSCSNKEETLFEELPASETGIDFANNIKDSKDFNIFNYRNFYNGGGVAIGDVNNDGLSDLFVSSNLEDNKLYLNKGNMRFEDISKQAGIVGKKFWSTGVTFADINGDGLMDIYVCNSGSLDLRGNQLYLNQGIKAGIPRFKEVAKEVGLEDGGFSTHAAFFDYDRDGDLDMYLLNNSLTPFGKLGYTNSRNQRDKLGGDKLFRNDSELSNSIKFTDVSESAGIFGSLIGFGLGITIGDVNNDNWPDIYISNDFYEHDYLYINQKNGTFKEDIVNEMPHTSSSSMGADIADINDDGFLDIYVTDMLPGNDQRLKTTSTFEGYNLMELKLKQGFWHQYMRNNLHLNNGDGTFSEIGQLAGVHATDWSWGALIFDMDNDGKKDIFVANGIAKDLTDQDFVDFLGDRRTVQQILKGVKFDYKDLTDKIPSVPIQNYAFKNLGDWNFVNQADAWGLGGPGFSNGSAYGDLDNDGDLDLVVNNVNAPISVFKNKSTEQLKNHYLRIKLKGTAKNVNGIGTTVTLYQKGALKVLQQMPNRGYQSSSDHQLVFGLGQSAIIDSMKVVWPDDAVQWILNPKSDQQLVLDYKNAQKQSATKVFKAEVLIADISQGNLNYQHQESLFNDFDRDVLLKQKFSTLGPGLAVGDVNGDGLDDLYLGGGKGQEKKLFLQQSSGKFVERSSPAFASDATLECSYALFFDADKDTDLDLLVLTGSNEFIPTSPELGDKLYINDGKGNFKISTGFPQILENGSVAAAADFDKDGDLDLFIGSRLISSKYGLSPSSSFLVNDGHGQFTEQSRRFMPGISDLGMVTDAVWADIQGDGYLDLIVSQDWGGIFIFKNSKGKQLLSEGNLPNSSGLWNTIHAADLDQDGDVDFVLGNMGLNTKIHASVEKPAILDVNDFDKNGTLEQIISSKSEDGNIYPMVLKGELQKAIPLIKKRFTTYQDFANKTIQDLFTAEERKGSIQRQIVRTESSLLINDGKGNFTWSNLPKEAQFSPIKAIETADFNRDGNLDILLAGNFFDVLPEWGRFDADYGLLLLGNAKGIYTPKKSKETGFHYSGQVRKMSKIRTRANGFSILLAKNAGAAQLFKVHQK
ncbi:VCBS repeat-containing protein [Aquirufa sp. OSTEICH-129A]